MLSRVSNQENKTPPIKTVFRLTNVEILNMQKTIFALGTALLFAIPPGYGQVANRPARPSKPIKPMYTVRRMNPAESIDPETIKTQAASGATIPFWSYSVVSPLDGKTYQGMMVGRSPFFNGHRTTVVNTDLIPVILTFEDTGTVFDPTALDSCLGDSVVNITAQSPIFQNASFTMNGINVGTTQYIDAFQRANFWNDVGGTPYHTLVGGSILSAVNVSVPAANGSTNIADSGCPFGTMDINWWDAYLRNTVMPELASQGINPTVFPIFLFDSVFEYDSDPNNCCILGYHSSYNSNNLLQTYSISSYDTSGATGGNDISTSSHELAEWMDDPDTNNPTPAWGHVGQTSGCQNNLEVGDPLSPGYDTPTNPFSVTMPNNHTYTLQELAFFSWFYRQSPSIGSAGMYSDNGTFSSAQPAVCQ